MFKMPEISDELLQRMAKQIKPIVKQRDKFYTIKEVDLKNIAFTWDPRIEKEIKIYEVDGEDLITFHSCGYYGFFKPSLEEVYASIAAFIVDWETITHFCLYTHDIHVFNTGETQSCRCRVFRE